MLLLYCYVSNTRPTVTLGHTNIVHYGMYGSAAYIQSDPAQRRAQTERVGVAACHSSRLANRMLRNIPNPLLSNSSITVYNNYTFDLARSGSGCLRLLFS